MALPSINEPYYSDMFDSLTSFYQNMCENAHENDFPMLIVPEDTYDSVIDEGKIPSECIKVGEIGDPWIRDFSTIYTSNKGEIDVKYRPNYLSKWDARYIENSFDSWLSTTPISKTSVRDIILDGGNFNHNGKNSAVISTRAWKDNQLGFWCENELVDYMKDKFGLDYIALIPYEAGDVTGHSDGIVKWLSENVLAVGDFSSSPAFQTNLYEALEAGLSSDVTFVTVPYVPQDELWNDWPSAKGVYVNAMTTSNAVYVPQFGLNEDSEALEIYEANVDSSKLVIPIEVGDEAQMGGTVRCLTKQFDGESGQLLIDWFNER